MQNRLRKGMTFSILLLIAAFSDATVVHAQLSPIHAVGRNQAGELEVVRVSSPSTYGSSEIYTGQNIPNGDWAPWNVGSYLGTVVQVAMGQEQNGKLAMFGLNSAGTVFQAHDPNEWSALGSYHHMTQIAVGQNLDGTTNQLRLEVFGTDYYGTLWHIKETTPNGSWLSDWETLGSGYKMGNIVVGKNQDGRLEVFGIDSDGTLLHLWQITSCHCWSGWVPLSNGYHMTQVEVGLNQDGTLEVFGIDNYGTLLHNLQMVHDGGPWSGWSTLGSGHHMQTIAVGQNQDGRLEVFGVDSYGTFLRIMRVPNGGWSEWGNLGGGGGMEPYIAVGQDSDGRLEVFAFDDRATFLHIWQSAPSSDNWSMWQNLQASIPSGGYAFCSGEGGYCNFTGTARVGYGANGRFVFEELTDGTGCNNGVFGDPDYGSVKACFIPGGVLGYSFCSMEGGFCSFTGTHYVEYGADGAYFYLLLTNGTACDNGVFGDPAFGVVKACFVGNEPPF